MATFQLHNLRIVELRIGDLGRLPLVMNYCDDAAFDCDSWSGLQSFVSGGGAILWDKMSSDLVIIIFC